MSAGPVLAEAAPRGPAAKVQRKQAARYLPSHADLFVAAMIVWLFIQAPGWARLMADGDTGWHIRTGEFILQAGHVPAQDLFSFTKPGAPWFAWEWLSDVLFALIHQSFGLAGVAGLCGVVIVAAAGISLRLMASQGQNAFCALALTVLGIGASSLHYLARPHVFTLLFLSVSVSVIWSDLSAPSRRIWLLVPLAAVWTNLHGGFLILVAALGLTSAGLAIEALCGSRPWRDAVRYGILALACGAASVCNPYGLQLHVHIAEYLRSTYIKDLVQEFQSPSFRSAGMFQFELLLFAGLISCALSAVRGRWAHVPLVLYLAHAALSSARHIPLFVLVGLPLIGAEASRLWTAWVRRQDSRSVAGTLDSISADLTRQFARLTPWAAALVCVAALLTPPQLWPNDFSARRFPLEVIARNLPVLSSSRVFTSDQWADYLIYRSYPKVRVYMDGRSDFYGESLGREYLKMIQLQPGWRDALERNAFHAVLADREWPLAEALRADAAWVLTDQDDKALLFIRK